MASSPPQKVSLYNINELKTTTDDAIPPYLTTLPTPYKFTQSHTLTDIRLALGYTAVLIAGTLFYIDYKHTWSISKPYTLPACILYFILNSALTYHIYFRERGTIFTGKRAGGQTLVLKSSVKKNVPVYKVSVTYAAPGGEKGTGKKWDDGRVVEGRFEEWFNIHGYLDQERLKSWLARNIEVVGLADPKALVADSKTGGAGTIGGGKASDVDQAILMMGSSNSTENQASYYSAATTPSSATLVSSTSGSSSTQNTTTTTKRSGGGGGSAKKRT